MACRVRWLVEPIRWYFNAPGALLWLLILWCIAIFAFLALVSSVRARDIGQWQYQDASISDYFHSLMQPDQPHMSCCGSADSFFADQTEVGPNGETIAIITDIRPDAPLGRQHITPGTKFIVPAKKIRKPPTYNPMGHTLIFIGGAGTVFCYEPMPLF